MKEVTTKEMLNCVKRELAIASQLNVEARNRDLTETDNQDSNDMAARGSRLPTPICSEFELRGTRIHDARTGKLVCTIWPEREASEKRLMGESWLDMRERTRPEREAIERHTDERAAAVCAFLNSQNVESTR